jgi:hypothetical protein
MKRLIAVVLVLLVPGVALAFDPSRSAQPREVRIAILHPDSGATPDATMVQTKVIHYLTSELKSRGFDAYETEWTYDDAARAEGVDVDYFVEVTGAGANSDALGGVGIGGRHGEVTVGVIVSHVAAELRLYDAQTMELLASENLEKRAAAVRPTSIGFGGGDVFAWIMVPFFERAQVRSAAKAAARDAATVITEAVQ